MKNIFCILLLAFCCLGSTHAQVVCTNVYYGSNTLYSTPVTTYTPPPASYKPVFINYVGRYGACNLVKDVSTTFVYSTLHAADSTGDLKVDGRKFLKALDALRAVEATKLNTITLTGKQEQQGIAARMKVNFASIFKNKPYCFKVAVINDERDIESANAFLGIFNTSLKDPACPGPDFNDDDDLKGFAVAPAYVDFDSKQDWAGDVDNIRDVRRPDDFNAKFLTRFFEQRFFDKLDDDAQNKFVDDMFKLSRIQSSIQPEIRQAGYTTAQLDIRSFFTCDELNLYNELTSAEDFLRMGPGNDIEGVQVKVAVPLLVNLINTTDALSFTNGIVGDLRFAYPETIGSLATLMDIKGASKESPDILKFSNVWKAEDIVPYSANIQMIFYKSDDPDFRREYLVKFLLNEQEVEISGLNYREFPYYKWDEVKAFYMKRLNEIFDVENMNDNMHNYLLNLR